MAKSKKIELFIKIHNEREFDHMIRHNAGRLICAEIYSYAFGWCTALDRLFTIMKLDWSDGQIILLKVPADEIECLRRFRDQSQPVYMFIVNTKVTRVYRGVDTVNFAEVAKQEIEYHKLMMHAKIHKEVEDKHHKDEEEEEAEIIPRKVYELSEPTPDELEWIKARSWEKQQEESIRTARRLERQAIRKRHRAELMVPYLTDINFVVFWPHCYHAHPELYEQWDANNIIMIGREEVTLTDEKITDIFYAGDAPLNEASLHKLKSGPALAICFRLLDEGVNFVALVRRILYEDIPFERKSMDEQMRTKTAFDRYKTFSPTREEIWRQRKEERERKKEEERNWRARYLLERQRLARQAKEEKAEAKRQEKEKQKLQLLKARNLAALDQITESDDDQSEDIVIPEELSEEVEEEEIFVEDEDEYFPPAGLLIPAFYSPPNDIAKSNGLAVLFPKLVNERVTPTTEFLPPHVLVLLEITKRYKAIEIMTPYKKAIIHMGIFKATTPYDSEHVAYTVKEFDTIDISSNTLSFDELKLAFMLSMEVDIPLLQLMDLNPLHVSRDCVIGEEECAAMFPVDYGDTVNQFEDFVPYTTI